MPRMDKLGKLATTVITQGSVTTVRLYATNIVTFDDTKNMVTLNTGEWRTAMTRDRMNQASNQFDLGYYVYSLNGEWFVNTNGKRNAVKFNGNTVTFAK